MNQGTQIVESALICPFGKKDLVELTKKEISQINAKISEGVYFFYHGAPVNVKLKQAFTSVDRSYIYPVFEDILYLKKLTAIVPKNRTAEPHKRVSQESIDEFYKEFGFGRKFKKGEPGALDIHNNPLSLEQLRDLGDLLPKSGSSFVSFVTHDVDSIHNMVFSTDFDQYIHLDFSLDRLRSVAGQLKQGTLYVLSDIADLPLKTDSVDAMFSFDYINKYEKDTQKEAYEELKRSLNAEGVSILLYDDAKTLHAKNQHTAELAAKKALKFVAPWKKTKTPNVYFYPVGTDQTADHQNFVAKTSLGRQFS